MCRLYAAFLFEIGIADRNLYMITTSYQNSNGGLGLLVSALPREFQTLFHFLGEIFCGADVEPHYYE